MTIEQDLRTLGFLWDNATGDAIQRFQEAYCGPPVGANTDGWLVVDRVAGPKTLDSLRWCLEHNRLSSNFAPSETWCKHCGRNWVRRELLSALEELRKLIGRPVSVLSVCRCPAHNKAVGGASRSQHLFGGAADFKTVVTPAEVKRTGRFSGIGTKNKWKSVCHADVRHVFDSAINTTSSTPNNPVMFVE